MLWNATLPDINRREVLSLLPLVVVVFWIGLYPKFFLDKLYPAADEFVTDFTVRYYEGRRTMEAHLVDFDLLKQRFEETGELAMIERAAQEEDQP